MNCARAQSGRGHNLRFCVFGNAPMNAQRTNDNDPSPVGYSWSAH
jgi:hypothetical protein